MVVLRTTLVPAGRSCRDGEAFRGVLGRVRDFLADVPEGDDAAWARALHLMGVIHLRVDEPVAAEEVLSRAMSLIGETPARAWLLDSFGQALIGQGTWVEARRNLASSLAAKRVVGDHLGPLRVPAPSSRSESRACCGS